MNIRIRRLEKRETDYETLFGVVFFPILAVTAWLAVSPLARFMPHCYLYENTGIPCPACGSFRCAEFILKGRLVQALVCQPLAFALAVAALLFVAYSWVVVIFRLPRIRLEGITPLGRRIALLAFVVIVLANWAYVIPRLGRW